jgi:hypothetical protein
MKSVFLVSSLTILLCVFSLPIFACVGARPLGMGGAFSAVADDINSVYWNPAGLAYLSGNVVTFTSDAEQNRDGSFKSSYPYYFAAGFGTENNYWALSYVKVSEGSQDEGRGKSWLYAATGRKITDRFSVGFKAGYREVEDPSFDFSVKPHDYTAHLPILFDIGLLYKCDYNISIGLLVQGITNFRPGISIKPFDNLIICAEDYDVLDLHNNHRLHWGVEYKIFDCLSLRTGWYWDHTYGIGYRNDCVSIDWFSWQDGEFPNYNHNGVGVTVNF